MAGLLTFLFLTALGLRLPMATLGGLAFLLSGTFTWFVNLQQYTNVALALPLLMLAVEGLVSAPRGRSVAFVAVSMGLVLLAGQPETALAVLLLAGFYFLYRTWPVLTSRPLAPLGWFTAASLLGFAVAAPLLLPFAEFVFNAHHLRAAGPPVAMEAPVPPAFEVSMLVPGLFDMPRVSLVLPENGYWDNLGGYSGVSVLLLVALGLQASSASPRRGPLMFFVAAAALLLLKNMGVPPFHWLGYLPFVDMVWTQRWAGPVLFFALACAAAVAGDILCETATDPAARRRHARPEDGGLLRATCAVLGLLLFALLPFATPLFIYPPFGTPIATVFGLLIIAAVLGFLQPAWSRRQLDHLRQARTAVRVAAALATAALVFSGLQLLQKQSADPDLFGLYSARLGLLILIVFQAAVTAAALVVRPGWLLPGPALGDDISVPLRWGATVVLSQTLLPALCVFYLWGAGMTGALPPSAAALILLTALAALTWRLWPRNPLATVVNARLATGHLSGGAGATALSRWPAVAMAVVGGLFLVSAVRGNIYGAYFLSNAVGGALVAVATGAVLVWVVRRRLSGAVGPWLLVLLLGNELVQAVPRNYAPDQDLLALLPWAAGLAAVIVLGFGRRAVAGLLAVLMVAGYWTLDRFADQALPMRRDVAVMPPYLAALADELGPHRLMASGEVLTPNAASALRVPDVRHVSALTVGRFQEYAERFLEPYPKPRGYSLWYTGYFPTDGYPGELRRDPLAPPAETTQAVAWDWWRAVVAQSASRTAEVVSRQAKYYDMLAVRYLLLPKDAAAAPAAPFAPLSDAGVRVYANPEALPRAYLVGRVHAATDAEAAWQRLGDADFDPRREAVVEADDTVFSGPAFSADAGAPLGEVEIRDSTANSVVLQARPERPALLVLADSLYPGWQVRVDGERREVLRVNGFARGVLLDAGDHRVVFSYEPLSFRFGLGLAALALVLSVALLFRVPPVRGLLWRGAAEAQVD